MKIILNNLKSLILDNELVKNKIGNDTTKWKRQNYLQLSEIIEVFLKSTLSDIQKSEMGYTISESTLERIFKYDYSIDTKIDLRTQKTLDKLSIFCKYKSWEDFQTQFENIYIEILSNANQLEELFKIALNEMVKITQTDYNQIFLTNYDNHNQKLLCVAYKIKWDKQQYRIASFEGLLGKSIFENKIIVINDVSKEEGYMLAVDETNSEAVIPIKSKNIILGVLNCESEVVEYFGESIIYQLQILADALGKCLIKLNWSNKNLYPYDNVPFIVDVII